MPKFVCADGKVVRAKPVGSNRNMPFTVIQYVNVVIEMPENTDVLNVSV